MGSRVGFDRVCIRFSGGLADLMCRKQIQHCDFGLFRPSGSTPGMAARFKFRQATSAAMGATASSCCREEKHVPTETIRVQRSEDGPFDQPLPGIADESEAQGDAQSAAADEEQLPRTFQEMPKEHVGLRRMCRGSPKIVVCLAE